IALFVLDDATPGPWKPGGAARWWLHHSLAALGEALGKRGASLILRRGEVKKVVAELAKETGASAVYWNRCYEPVAVSRDKEIEAALEQNGIEANGFNGALLFEPWEIAPQNGDYFKVFTPFWKACLRAGKPVSLLPAPETIAPPRTAPPTESLSDWGLLPTKPDWAAGFASFWRPGEAGARKRLADFLETGIAHYAEARDRPDRNATSKLSPHLHWGEIGPRQIKHAVDHALDAGTIKHREADKFMSEIGWREFSHHLLYHFPNFPEQNVRNNFDAFPWNGNAEDLRAWQRGRTGFPIVDAGLRELWTSGTMHNRVRMIAASFLIKDLLIDWRAGAAWFWDTLLDADLANNSASWQWVAGCGADAAPYFRIFNPVLQGEKFDPDGAYVKRWIPELADMPKKYVHKPWRAPEDVLEEAGVTLGETYPKPIVDHAVARRRALEAFEAVKTGRAS
ncbi:MAG: deoxyribodipyrimidine photo-lyase, partial [Amphiplicatus sp.]